MGKPGPAREPRSRALFLATALLLGLGAGAADAAGVHDSLRKWSFRNGACRNDLVGGLVGRTVQDALSQVRPMQLMAVRVLDRWTPAHLHVVPERLTMGVHDNGGVVRAFGR